MQPSSRCEDKQVEEHLDQTDNHSKDLVLVTLTAYETTRPKMSLLFSSASNVEEARDVSSPFTRPSSATWSCS